MAKVLRALLASGLLVFMFAVPAFANDLHQDIPDGGIVAVHDEEECEEGDVEDGQILWHFIHTDTDGSDLPSQIHVTFSDGSSQDVDGFSNGGGSSVVMYNVYTDADVNLTGASDDIVNDGNLNLSHTCVGGPPPEIPEAPAALLLPLMALAVLGGYMVINRRRATSAV